MGFKKKLHERLPLSTEAVFHENCDLSTSFPNGFDEEGEFFFKAILESLA